MDQRSRVKNLIIHSKEKTDAATDALFTKDLFKDLEIRPLSIDYIERIGRKSDSEQGAVKRPIKIAFKSEDDNNKVLDNLRNLKGKSGYKGVGITNDYTFRQRLLMKDFREKAKEKNQDEEQNRSNLIWKVRGTPSTGLTLRRFKAS